MKPLLLLICGGLMGACASEEAPTAEEVRDQFQRGISGQGKIVPLNPEQDRTLNSPATQPGPTPESNP